ncbi:MAG: gliding motility-associated C-terminal domain-containing protein, partial [Phaeodactylibacter sp.]|nr:gliding motility-associated C-terminal domain-containing protein [Phaeodactylibacter sp.]
HSTGSGLMLVVNGSEQSGQKVWCETVPVEPGQDYYFSAWVMLASQSGAPQLQLNINDEVASETFFSSENQCEWTEMGVLWSDATVMEATICLTNLNTVGPGNDFALDDLYFGPICSATDSITFELSDLKAEAEITLFPDCLDTTGAAFVTPTGGTMPYTYVWDSGELTFDASGLKPGVHRITVTDEDGCHALVGFIMPEPEYPTLDSLIPRPTSCGKENGLIRIIPDEGTAPFMYSIDGGDSFQQSQLFPDLAAGTYSIFVEDAEGCTYETQATIADSEGFSVEIQAPLGTTICEEAELLLEVPGTYTRYRWSTNDTTTTLTVREPGIYGVVVVDADRCEAVDTIEITVCNDYQIPNVFTPNGDEVNDLFGPVSRDAVRIIFLQVVNRWGEVIYVGQEPWDGTYKGEPHPADVFAYRMLLRDRENQIMLEQGEVTLLR